MQTAWDTKKVAHTLKMRLLSVKEKQALGPDMYRITLTGTDLHEFYSPGFDDHVKLVFPEPGQKVPVLPQLGESGMVFPAGQPKPILRDYTPRAYRESEQELDIDFVLHGSGPACEWAQQAKVGDKLGVAGPRGSMLVAQDFDWHVLIGDEAAVPAMARRIEELQGQTAIQVFVYARSLLTAGLVNAPDEVPVHWVPTFAGMDGLLASVSAAPVLSGRGFVWIAAESSMAKSIREYWVHERQHDKRLIRASSYWRQGEIAVHEQHND